MKLAVHHRCDEFSSYRAARVKSLFNVESGANFQLEADLDLDSAPWQIGVIVGPSGSGKTSMGRALQRRPGQCSHLVAAVPGAVERRAVPSQSGQADR